MKTKAQIKKALEKEQADYAKTNSRWSKGIIDALEWVLDGEN